MANGYEFYAPGVLVSEVLYVLCKRAELGTISPATYTQAVQNLAAIIGPLRPSPHGDFTLVGRAEAIRSKYSCRRTSDAIYIALAEQLSLTLPTVLLTFDQDLPKQAAKQAPGVHVRLLQV
ncbi:MAG: type II toxin-antitoxin system VapC family toxin [Capsulimonadaceae bacterium]